MGSSPTVNTIDMEKFTIDKNVEEHEITFKFLSWDAGWDFDKPILMVEPVVRYDEEGTYPGHWIWDIGADLATEFELESHDIEETREFYGWPSIARFKKIIEERFNNKETWVTKNAIATAITVKFTRMMNGEYDMQIVKTEEY